LIFFIRRTAEFKDLLAGRLVVHCIVFSSCWVSLVPVTLFLPFLVFLN